MAAYLFCFLGVLLVLATIETSSGEANPNRYMGPIMRPYGQNGPWENFGRQPSYQRMGNQGRLGLQFDNVGERPMGRSFKALKQSDPTDDLAPQEAYCRVSPDHTACKYHKSKNQRGQCGDGIVARGYTDEEINQLVDYHNEKRALVASGQAGLPRAADMVKFTWDREAAAIAQTLVDQCVMEHEPNPKERATVLEDPAGISNGQNLAAGGGIFPALFGVEMWFNEIQKFTGSVGSYQWDDATGHFTQMIWANTVRVGCGTARFIKDGVTNTLSACNYLPGGNFPGLPIYAEGDPCSSCPSSFPNCDNNLCRK